MNQGSHSRVHTIIINSIRLILALIFLFALRGDAPLMLFVSATAFIVTFIPYVLATYFHVEIPAKFEILTLLFIYGLLFISEVRTFSSVWWWDVLLNFIAALALGFIGLSIMYVLYKNKIIGTSHEFIAILTFCFAFSIGGLWEIFEFCLDTLFGSVLQTSLLDTMEDLIVNAIGALIVSTFGYISIKRGKFVLMSTLLASLVERHITLLGLERALPSKKVQNIIRQGESSTVEFKSTFRTNFHTKEYDKRMEYTILKTIAAFLNTSGGRLLVGVTDSGHVLGLDHDNFQNDDKLSLHLTNLIKSHIGNEYLPFITHEIVSVHEKKVLFITCLESTKRVFLKIGHEEEFFVRNGPASVKLHGSSLVDYIEHKFKPKE